MEISRIRIDAWEFMLAIECDICGHIQNERMMSNSHPQVEQRLRMALMKRWAMHVCNPKAKKEKVKNERQNVKEHSIIKTDTQSFIPETANGAVEAI